MTSQEKRTLVVKFRIEGNLRFLSHQETMTMWSRALARSGLNVCFSSGYNPHPRFSLPLPRSVGVRSDDEILCALVSDDTAEAPGLAGDLQECLPAGCVVAGVALYPGKVSFRAEAAVYEFALGSAPREDLRDRVATLNASAAEGRAIPVVRQAKEHGRASTYDAAPYIASASICGDRAIVHCRITPGGTVRVDELMELLGLRTEDVAPGVLRKSVHWERN